ncbi:MULTISPECIES: TetR/AcrR family transcriptional regulator [Acinetobacter]|uniref:TetR/AcrR family transcriptional regulator n=1 Tax=Acinetobacter indicus TaxID=756892 RepID=A0A6C0Y766_9GAMM|nr:MULTISPECIES: TetR/AcrR family transcriptional regulator [Acinetobacter]QIC71722.1 TetR/AcrR family transcriptional regulator [Acinetobacter indicus]QKQ71630.1 TetR/AcrR family transcriptional regulator [Acinetobacter sp. 10FS3-1]
MSGIRKFDEQQLLGTVLDLFWKNGWQATSLNDISKETGIQRGSLYNAYKGKDELFLLAYDIYIERFIKSVESNMVGDTLKDIINGLFKAAIDNMTGGEKPKGCLTTKILIEIDLTNELIQGKISSFVTDMTEIITLILSNPKFVDELRLPPKDAAELIFTFLRGIAVMEKHHKDPKKLLSICDSLVSVIVVDI